MNEFDMSGVPGEDLSVVPGEERLKNFFELMQQRKNEPWTSRLFDILDSFEDFLTMRPEPPREWIETFEKSGKQFANALNTNVEFKKEKGKVWFHFTPSFRFNKIDETGTGSSETYRTGTFVNSSDNTSHRLSSSNNTGLRADVTFRELGGKKNRNLRFDFDGNYGGI